MLSIFKNKLNKLQLIKNKSFLFSNAKQWGPFYSYYFVSHYKNQSLLNLNIMFFFCKKTNLLISKISQKKGIVAVAFFNDFLYKSLTKQNCLKNFYNVLFNKTFNFFSNFYEIMFKQRTNTIKKYTNFSSYRKPSLIFLMKNKKVENSQTIKYHYSINRSKLVMIQSLLINQIYNGVAYCIYINNCVNLYFYYYYAYKTISDIQWKNLRFKNIKH